MATASATVLNTVPQHERVVFTNEKVTGPPAIEMLRRSCATSDESNYIEVLDNATGGGILVAELLDLVSMDAASSKIRRIVAGDIDERMLSYVRDKQERASSVSRHDWQIVEVMKIDQQSIPLLDSTFTHLFSNFGVFFCQNDEKALREAYRVLKPAGIAGFTTWKTIAWWSEIAQPAVARFIPEAPVLPPPGQLFPSRGWSDPGAIPAKLAAAGFKDVQVSEYSFTPDVAADEFAEATGVLVKIVTKRLWTEEQNVKYTDQIEPALRQYLHENFKEGKWDGKMTAIISLGRKA